MPAGTRSTRSRPQTTQDAEPAASPAVKKPRAKRGAAAAQAAAAAAPLDEQVADDIHDAGAAAAPSPAARKPDSPAAPEAETEAEEDVGPLHTFKSQPQLSAALAALDLPALEPSAFLLPTAKLSETARSTAQALYHYAVLQLSSRHSKGEPQSAAAAAAASTLLPDLHIDSFDAEQIWLQLEQHTDVALRRVRRLMKRSAGAVTILKPSVQATINQLALGEDSGSDDAEMDEGDEGEDDDGTGSSGDSEGDEGEGSSGEEEDEEPQARPARKARTGLRPAEDAFMRFDDMEKFLQNAEQRRGGSDDDEEDGEEEEEDEEPGFDASDGGEGMDEDEREMEAMLRAEELRNGKTRAARGKGAKAAAGNMYGDFFGKEDGDDGPEDEDGEEEEDDGEGGEDEEEEDEGEEEGGSEDGEDGDGPSAARGGPAGPSKRATGSRSAPGSDANMSSHERRLARLQDRISELEEVAMGEKDWMLRGEAEASRRPINSALEIDMDFETSARPPPQPTEEVAADLEAMIKARIAEHKFDDVVRQVAAPTERRSKVVELDDEKSKKGLGDVYAEKYVAAVLGGSGAAEDKEAKIREEAKLLFAVLCGKLDALSHFHFTPRPIVADMSVRTEVAAVVMEEAGPTAASGAALQRPAEVFKAEAGGAPKAEGEMDKDDRKRRRAQKKRGNKAEAAQKDVERRNRAVTLGGEANIIGRKSDAAKQVAAQQKGASGKKGSMVLPAAPGAAAPGASAGGRSEFGKSRVVFAKLQEQQDQAKAGIKPVVKKDSAAPSTKSGMAFKL